MTFVKTFFMKQNDNLAKYLTNLFSNAKFQMPRVKNTSVFRMMYSINIFLKLDCLQKTPLFHENYRFYENI